MIAEKRNVGSGSDLVPVATQEHGPQLTTIAKHLDERMVDRLSYAALAEAIESPSPALALRRLMAVQLLGKNGAKCKSDPCVSLVQRKTISDAQAGALKQIEKIVTHLTYDVAVSGFKAERVDYGRTSIQTSEELLDLERVYKRWRKDASVPIGRRKAMTVAQFVIEVSLGQKRDALCREVGIKNGKFKYVLRDGLDLFISTRRALIG